MIPSRSSPLRRWLGSYRALVLVVLVALVIRLVNAVCISGSPLFATPVSDELEHYNLATRLAAGDWLAEGVGRFFRPPLFAYVLGVVFAIFGPSHMLTHVVVMGSDVLAVGLWYLVARRAFPKVPALVGTLFVAGYWPFVHFSGTGYMESFAMMLNAALLLCLLRHTEAVRRGGGGWGWLVAAGIFAGGSILTRPTVMLVMPGLALALLWLHVRVSGRSVKALVAPAVLTTVTLIAVSPNAIRHWILYKEFIPMGVATELAFHMGNNRDGWGWDVASPGVEFSAYTLVPTTEANIDPTPGAVRAYWKARNHAYITEAPGQFLKGLGLKLLQVVSAREVHCTNDFEYQRGLSWVQRWLPGLGLMLPLALAGLFLGWERRPWERQSPDWRLSEQSSSARESGMPQSGILPLRKAPIGRLAFPGGAFPGRILLILWTVPYLFGVALYLAISRHRLPAMPPLVLFAGFGAWALVVALQQRRIRSLAAGAGGLLMGAVIAHLPVIPAEYAPHEQWWTQVNLAVAELALRHPAPAEAYALAATRILPRKPEGWRQLSVAYARQNEPKKSADADEHVLTLLKELYPKCYPLEAETLQRIALARIAAGQLELAMQAATQFRTLLPDDPRGALMQVRAAKAAGDEDAAKRFAAEVLKLDPGNEEAKKVVE